MEQIKLLPLLKLCEPVFTYICELRCKSGAEREEITYDLTSQTVNDLLEAINTELPYATPLWRKYRRIEIAILCFIDFAICDSQLPFIDKWDQKRLAYTKGEMGGDYKFYTIIEELTSDYSVDSEECLVLLYYCIQLGFTGVYKEQPDEVTKVISQIEDRVPFLQELKKESFLADVFNNIDSRNIMVRTWLSCKRIFIITLLLCVLYILYNISLYYLATIPLFEIFDKILMK
jgi:type IV/VI secretion system ImpK/VasF family protein